MVDLTSVMEKLAAAVRVGVRVELTPFEAAILHRFFREMLLISGDFGEFDDSFMPKEGDLTLEEWLAYCTGEGV